MSTTITTNPATIVQTGKYLHGGAFTTIRTNDTGVTLETYDGQTYNIGVTGTTIDTVAFSGTKEDLFAALIPYFKPSIISAG